MFDYVHILIHTLIDLSENALVGVLDMEAWSSSGGFTSLFIVNLEGNEKLNISLDLEFLSNIAMDQLYLFDTLVNGKADF